MCSSCFATFQDTFLLGAGCVGLAVYIAVLVVLIKFSNKTFKRPFFVLCISLGFVEVAGLTKSIIDPAVFEYMRENPNDRSVQRLYGGLFRIPWYATLYHQVYIALERCTALLYPKLHDKMWTRKAMAVHYTTLSILSLASNLCVCTSACEYVLYPDGASLFYNMSIPGARLHNQIVDLGVQPCTIVIVILIYVVTGVKVIRTRRQIRANLNMKNDSSVRTRRVETMLVLQGFLVATPQSVVMIIYHIIRYVPMPNAVKLVMDLIMSIFSKLVYSASPFLYIFLNTDIRMKLAQLLVGKSASIMSAASPAAPITGGAPVQTNQQQFQRSAAIRDRIDRIE